jgi:iron complex outermembrane receptor protein
MSRPVVFTGPFAAACAASLFASTTALSQDAESDDENRLQEVVVTAQFREQNLQDTPIAITAVTAEMLEARSQTSVFEVAAQAPNVTLKPAGQAFGPSMVAFIRGVGQTDFIFALEPGVGIYVDDVYHSTLTGSLLDLMDLQRVEVLRGPQGTLAGRNSIGGAIKLYSKVPDGTNGGDIAVTYGSLDRLDVRASGEFTVVPDKMFVRIAGASRQRDGYIDVLDYGCSHPGSGVPIIRTSEGCKVDEQGDQSYTSGRVSLRWLASDAVELNFVGDVVDDSSGTAAGTLLFGNNPSTLFNIDDGNPATPTVGFQNHIFVPYSPFPGVVTTDPINDPYVNYATMVDNSPTSALVPWKPVILPSKNTLQMWGVSGKLDWKLSETLSLTSISAYRTYDSVFNQDSDLSPIALTLVGNRVEHEQFTQEIRLNGAFGTRADWTVGGFYLDQDSFYEGRIDLNYTATAMFPIGLDFIHGPDPTPAKTWALFAHSAIHLTDAANLTLGARYSDEKKDYTHFRHNPDGTVPSFTPGQPNFQVGPVNGLPDHFADTRVDWRVGFDYNFSDTFMSYIQTSTGYKGGGVNPRPFFPEQRASFAPETITAYELGFKSTLLDRRMRLNGAIFFNDYEDVQLTLNACETPFGPLPAAPCAKPANVGSAEVKGAELEVEIYPTEGLALDASASYLDFEYTELRLNALANSSTVAPLDMVTPYTPEWKASAGISYTFPATTLGTFALRLDANYQSEVYTNATNDFTNLIDDYTLTNARLSWKGQENEWEAAFEVTNLSDELYYLTIFDQRTSVGQVTGQPGLPRMYGITVKRRF